MIVRATLYLLDKFAVSDEFYHEFSMSYKDLPRSYKIKGLRGTMSRDVSVVRLGEGFHGAYRPFEHLLALCLSREVGVELSLIPHKKDPSSCILCVVLFYSLNAIQNNFQVRVLSMSNSLGMGQGFPSPPV